MIGLLRRHREFVALALLLLLGAVVAQIASSASTPAGGPTLASEDASPAGSLALALWLEQLGYRVTRLQDDRSTPDDSIRYLFILRPTLRFSQEDASAVVNWVRRGGTLVYVPAFVPDVGASGPVPGDGLSSSLNLTLEAAPNANATGSSPASPVIPFFVDPPASRFRYDGFWALRLDNAAWVPLVDLDPTNATSVIAAERRYGSGRVFAVASDAFFSNAHVGDDDNSTFVLNVLARGAEQRTVAFDEYHHGITAATDLLTGLRGVPVGWAIAYGALVTFGFAVWSGRRFGPPVTRPRPPGRSAADYVSAFAGLLQRGPGKPGAAIAWSQTQYARLVRRSLSRAHGVRADLPAGDLARLLADRRPIDAAALARHLTAIDAPARGEGKLLAEMRELEPILQTLVPPST